MIGKQIPAGTGFKNIKDLQYRDTKEEIKEYAQMDEETSKLFDENLEDII